MLSNNKVPVRELESADFAPFGSFLDPENCGDPIGGDRQAILFYPDRMIQQFGASNNIAFMPIIIRKRPLEITVTEKHERTEEVIGGFNVDVVFHVALEQNGQPDMGGVKMFRLPAGWWVRFKRNVWHHAPFVAGEENAVGMVALPPHTYSNDCVVVTLPKPIEL